MICYIGTPGVWSIPHKAVFLCRTAQVAEEIWAQTFKYLADNKVMFEGILLKPSMVTPGADSGKKVLCLYCCFPYCVVCLLCMDSSVIWLAPNVMCFT